MESKKLLKNSKIHQTTVYWIPTNWRRIM